MAQKLRADELKIQECWAKKIYDSAVSTYLFLLFSGDMKAVLPASRFSISCWYMATAWMKTQPHGPAVISTLSGSKDQKLREEINHSVRV